MNFFLYYFYFDTTTNTLERKVSLDVRRERKENQGEKEEFICENIKMITVA